MGGRGWEGAPLETSLPQIDRWLTLAYRYPKHPIHTQHRHPSGARTQVSTKYWANQLSCCQEGCKTGGKNRRRYWNG